MNFYSVVVHFTDMSFKTVKRKFKFSKEASNSFKYHGLLVSQNKNGIKISQNDYIENFRAVEVLGNKSNEEKLTKKIFQFMSISGQLSWVTGQTSKTR